MSILPPMAHPHMLTAAHAVQNVRSATPWAALLLLSVALFNAFFHWQILDITNINWLLLGSDNGENALGLHAWLHDPNPALWRTTLLGAPEGTPLLFTDSNPLASTIAFLFKWALPADAQILGWWLLTCLFLQLSFAWLLLRKYAPNAIALWCGVILLAALPTLFNRYVHVNLMAHWLILWAIWRFDDEERAASFSGWAVLIAITTLIHSYLLIMVAAIWASSLLERLFRDRSNLPRLLGEGAVMLAIVVMLAWILGVFGDFSPSGNYGAFAMPIDALWNPAVSGLSTFLPAIAQRPGRAFEGFQYLGLGLLILLPVALWARKTTTKASEAVSMTRYRWLIPAMIALTLLAVSNYPDFAGYSLPRLVLPISITDALDAVRASGRMFWPVAYIMVFATIRMLYRLPAKRAGQMLLVALIIQVADIAPMAAAIRAETASVNADTPYPRLTNPEWEGLISGATDIAFVPERVTEDLALFQQIAWRAAKHQVPVRNVYVARTSHSSAQRQRDESDNFRQGQLVPGRLYVLTKGEPVPPPLMDRARPLDGVTIVYIPAH